MRRRRSRRKAAPPGRFLTRYLGLYFYPQNLHNIKLKGSLRHCQTCHSYQNDHLLHLKSKYHWPKLLISVLAVVSKPFSDSDVYFLSMVHNSVKPTNYELTKKLTHSLVSF